MTTALQDKKFNYVFNWFDQNGNGWLTRDDFEKMAGQCTAMAREDDHKNKAAIKSGFMLWWSLLQESGEDKTREKVSKEEFLRSMESAVTAPENFENAVGTIADGLLGALDTDGNGSLSLTEYVRMYEGVGVTPATSGEAFKRLDRDGNGEISHAEFRQAVAEYYLSPDPNAPGNWLLGPMDAFK